MNTEQILNRLDKSKFYQEFCPVPEGQRQAGSPGARRHCVRA